MTKLKYKYEDQETKVTLENYQRLYVYDNNGNEYAIKADKFGGIEICANDGKISVEPSVSNVITIKTVD
ncbi:MAG TPA: hypothetical protein HA277_02865 [Methanosphaera sp.]|jgi:hypothetical protein|nr:hypothetical protein [Methanosphaera sp.]